MCIREKVKVMEKCECVFSLVSSGFLIFLIFGQTGKGKEKGERKQEVTP